MNQITLKSSSTWKKNTKAKISANLYAKSSEIGSVSSYAAKKTIARNNNKNQNLRRRRFKKSKC